MTRLQQHRPLLTPAKTPLAWLVYCEACSDDAEVYVYPCRKSRMFPPRLLQAPQETLLEAAAELRRTDRIEAEEGRRNPVAWLHQRARAMINR